MKKNFTSKIVLKMSTCMASLAFIVAAQSVNAMCFYLIHQPKMPDNIREFKR